MGDNGMGGTLLKGGKAQCDEGGLRVPLIVTGPGSRGGSVAEYNTVMLKVMKEAGVAVDDLNKLITPHLAKLQIPNDVHDTKKGSALLAKQVAAEIENALAAK